MFNIRPTLLLLRFCVVKHLQDFKTPARFSITQFDLMFKGRMPHVEKKANYFYF